jgi:MFS family permease
MYIQYIEPLTRGWNRMKKALFQPFDLAKWFTIGFTAFLASLLDGNGGGGNNTNIGNRRQGNLDDFFNFPAIAWDWLNENPFWFSLILAGVVFVFAVVIVLAWLSSRGKFMFLHNVVHNAAEVKKPWYEYRREGNSLFLWRLVYGLIVFAVVMFSFVYAFLHFRDAYYESYRLSETLFSMLGIVIYLFILFAFTAYISLFLKDFIVPIMYKHRLSAMQAWYKFLPLMSRHIGHFILYGLFVLVLIILVVIAVVLFGFFTCCIGFFLLIIPYIGSVVLLPISYTFRAFSLEYLAQFGDAYNLFPETDVDDLVVEP